MRQIQRLHLNFPKQQLKYNSFDVYHMKCNFPKKNSVFADELFISYQQDFKNV